MTTSGIIIGLLFFAAILHFLIPTIYGNNEASQSAMAFGSLHVTFGILLMVSTAPWLLWTTFFITLGGMIGVITQLRPIPQMRNMTVLLIGIDLMILILLASRSWS